MVYPLNKMINLVLQVISGIIGLWLAINLIPGVEFIGDNKYLFFAGLILGLLNFFLKPILNLITLPLRLLTFGFFSLVINVVIIWLVDVLFPEIKIPGIIPLFWTTLIIWGLSFLISYFSPRGRRSFI